MEYFQSLKRLHLALNLLKKDQELLKLQKKIAHDVEDKIRKQSKELLLREQMRAIKKELGIEKDDKSALIEKFEAQLKGKIVPEGVRTVIDEELKKLSFLEGHSTEHK